MDSLSKKAYETIHRGKLSVEELADEIGVSISMLYKAANPNDEAVDIKLRWLIPLMRATANYSILHHIANRLGFVCIKIPRSRRMKPAEIAEHQKHTSEYIHTLMLFASGEISREETLEIVMRELAEVASARKMVEAGSQGELFED